MDARKSRTSDLCTVLRATQFAAAKHKMQRRCDADATPYINHPISLADLLVNEAMVEDPVVICAALLHDTVEDTETTFEELAIVFGHEVAMIVLEVSDDKTLAKAERKRLQIEHAPTISPRAKLVKLADKICNLRDIERMPPVGWSAQRKDEYFAWAVQVVAGLRGTHAGLEEIFDAIVRRWTDRRRSDE
ncbi:MAG: HD domain-containing protein [Rhodocyclaceae bacterium]|nr:HD domain-containing protein [Rhodocyclaceae bacterium]